MLTYITLQFDNKDLQFQAKDGVQKAIREYFRPVTTMTRRIVTNFEDTVRSDQLRRRCCRQYGAAKSIYQKTVPLAPGTYRLNVVAKDVVGGNMNNYEVALTVPRLDPRQADVEHYRAGRPDRERCPPRASARASS